MTGLSEETLAPWRSLCQPGQLAFRAACDFAAAPSARPVKRRVIERLAASAEADAVFRAVWQIAMQLSPPIEPRFIDALGKDLQWTTLVAETIASERRWSDLFPPSSFSSIADRGVAFLEKCFGKDAGSLAKVVSMVIAGTGTLAIALQIDSTAQRPIRIPVELQLPANNPQFTVQLAVSSQQESIPVSFKSLDGNSAIPVRFESTSTDLPVKLHFESDGPGFKTPAAALNLVADRLDQTNLAIDRSARQIESLVTLTSNENANGLIRNLMQVNGSVDDLAGALDRAVKLNIAASEESSHAVTSQLSLVANSGLVSLRSRTVQIQPNSVQTLFVPIVTGSGIASAPAKITLCTQNISATEGARLKILDTDGDEQCGGQKNYTATLPGREVTTLDGRWVATVNAFEHHWYGVSSALVTVRPVIEDMSIDHAALTKANN